MKVKKRNNVGIMMLLIMLVFSLTATADATPIVSYSGSINTIANDDITATKLGDDIDITGNGLDMAVGSTLVLTCPSGLKFDTTVALAVATNIVPVGFTISTSQPPAYSADGTKITLTIAAVPVSSGLGSITFKSTNGDATDLAVLPTALAGSTDQNECGLQFDVLTNGGTGFDLHTKVPRVGDGDICVLERPAIAAAFLVDCHAMDILLTANIDPLSTALSANTPAAVVDDTTGANIPFVVGTGVGPTPNIDASGNIALDATNKKLIHVTGVTPVICAAGLSGGNEVGFNTTISLLNLTNALGPVNGLDTTITTTVTLNPAGAVVNSISVGDAPKRIGDAADAFSTSSTFTATVSATPQAVVKVRISAMTAGITWSGANVVGSTVGGVGTILMPTAGVTVVQGDLNGNNLVGSGFEGSATAQASLDNFANHVDSADGALTIDRKQPSLVPASFAAPNRTTITGTLDEAVKSATVVPANFSLIGTNSGVTISGAALGADNKAVTLTTASNLAAASDNQIQITDNILDLAGNRAITTTVSAAFPSPGDLIASISITGVNGVTGQTVIKNGDTINAVITGPAGVSPIALVTARVVNAATSGITDTATGAVSTFTEGPAGTYTGTVVMTSSTAAAVKLQGTMDFYAQSALSPQSLIVDNVAPTVASAGPIGLKAVLLGFSEQMKDNAAIILNTNYAVSGSSSGAMSGLTVELRPGATQVLLKWTSTLVQGETATVTAALASGIADVVGNGLGMPNTITYTAPAPDTTAPIILNVTSNTDGLNVTTCFDDPPNGVFAVDITNPPATSNTKVIAVYKSGVPLDGVVTNDLSNVCSIFTPTVPFTPGEYQVVADVADLAGNLGVRTQVFTVVVCGTPVASASPALINPLGTSTVSVTGAIGPFTPSIVSDTSGGASLTGTIPGSGPWTINAGPGSDVVTLIVIRVTDSCSGRTSDVEINVRAVCAALTLDALKSAVNGEKITIIASGGVPPYVYELVSSETGAAIDPISGDYLAPAAAGDDETETIRATDTTGCTGTIQVKISVNAVASPHTVGSGTSSVTIHGPVGATYEKTGVGSLADNVFSASDVNGVGVVKVTATSGEWAKVVILVNDGICTVKSPVPVADVNMDGVVDVNDLPPVIGVILGE